MRVKLMFQNTGARMEFLKLKSILRLGNSLSAVWLIFRQPQLWINSL